MLSGSESAYCIVIRLEIKKFSSIDKRFTVDMFLEKDRSQETQSEQENARRRHDYFLRGSDERSIRQEKLSVSRRTTSGTEAVETDSKS